MILEKIDSVKSVKTKKIIKIGNKKIVKKINKK